MNIMSPTPVEERLIRMETHLEYIAKHLSESGDRFLRYEERLNKLEAQQTKWQGALMAITGLYTITAFVLNYMKG